MNLGNVIKELRRNKCLSQTELATAIGMTQTSLSQIEGNIKRPHHSSVNKLCVELGVTEPILYILATELSDVPDKNKELYNALFPMIKELALKIINT